MNAHYNKPPNGDTNPTLAAWYEQYFSVRPDVPKARPFETDIYVISFNNPVLVEYQIKTLRRFFRSPHSITIIDNNCGLHPIASAAVRLICANNKVTYISAPDNWYQHHFDGTQKLGTTMSWVFNNVIKHSRKPQYFGFLDHDCFLFRPTTIDDLCGKNKMYGRLSMASRNIGTPWCLHVVANFYEYDFVKELLLDFRASSEFCLDTGGANYSILYADKEMDDYKISEVQLPCPAGGEYEIIDDRWMHVYHSTNSIVDEKLLWAYGWLDNILHVSE